MVTRRPTTPPDVPAEFRDLHRQVEQWRQTRRHREPMPEPLWALAAKLACQHGVARVSRHLRLGYYSLKDRHDAVGRGGIARPEQAPAFVELALPAPVSMPECIVELEHPRGARMRIHLKSNTAPDLTALAGSFWSAAS